MVVENRAKSYDAGMKKRRIPLWVVVSLVICCLSLLCWEGLLRVNNAVRVMECQGILTRIGLAFQTYNQMP